MSRNSILVSAFVVLLACDRPPSGGIREWGPSDHDRHEETGREANATQPAGNGGAKANPGADEDTLAAVAWDRQCVRCHGVGGHGDGPEGPMVNASDLTREDWQAKVSDADIAKMIRTGKGKMPKFQLSETLVRGLVKRVRSLRGG